MHSLRCPSLYTCIRLCIPHWCIRFCVPHFIHAFHYTSSLYTHMWLFGRPFTYAFGYAYLTLPMHLAMRT